MEKTATPQAKPKNKHFWNFQPASGDNPPELILYGDIASETWWGDEVTPRQFTEELDALGAVPEIVVRSSAKSIVVPSDTMSRPAMMLPNPVICASSISVRGKMPLQKPASSRIAMLSTVENIALVFCAISSLTA